MANDPRQGPSKTTFGWAPDVTALKQAQAQQPQQAVQQPQPAPVRTQYVENYVPPHAPPAAYPQQQPHPYAMTQAAVPYDQAAFAQQQQAFAHEQQQLVQAQQYAQQQQAQQHAQQQAHAQQVAYEQQQAQAYAQQIYAQQAAARAQQAEHHAQQAQQQAKSSSPFEAEDSTLRTSANATVGVSDRVRFIRLTYLHLLFAVLAFAGLEYLLQTNDMLLDKVSVPLTDWALTGRNWGIVLVAFAAVSWIADYWASHSSSKAMQYFGLFIYVCAEAVIFVPLLQIVDAETHAILSAGGQEPHILRDSAFATIAIFLALTISVFVSKKDFSFLRSGLMMATGASIALVAMAILFGFNLGLAFSVGMVLLAAGYMLYQTSGVLAHYNPRSHVAAALALFSSLALMFWYVIRIFLRMRSN